jgi:hypothetical protein
MKYKKHYKIILKKQVQDMKIKQAKFKPKSNI